MLNEMEHDRLMKTEQQGEIGLSRRLMRNTVGGDYTIDRVNSFIWGGGKCYQSTGY